VQVLVLLSTYPEGQDVQEELLPLTQVMQGKTQLIQVEPLKNSSAKQGSICILVGSCNTCKVGAWLELVGVALLLRATIDTGST
jgi:hypothetical protein